MSLATGGAGGGSGPSNVIGPPSLSTGGSGLHHDGPTHMQALSSGPPQLRTHTLPAPSVQTSL